MTRQDDIEQELTISVVINGMRWLQWLDGIVTENRGYKKRTKKNSKEGEKKKKNGYRLDEKRGDRVRVRVKRS
jgi:flagellar biosynthesis/type III secretory pathway M-ring protein FliF/YscJ